MIPTEEALLSDGFGRAAIFPAMSIKQVRSGRAANEALRQSKACIFVGSGSHFHPFSMPCQPQQCTGFKSSVTCKL